MNREFANRTLESELIIKRRESFTDFSFANFYPELYREKQNTYIFPFYVKIDQSMLNLRNMPRQSVE